MGSINIRYGFLSKICSIVETLSLTHIYYPFPRILPAFPSVQEIENMSVCMLRENTPKSVSVSLNGIRAGS